MSPSPWSRSRWSRSVHVIGRLGWVAVAGTSGAVMHPSLASVGVVFPLLGAAGFVLSMRDRRARSAAWLLVAIAAQAAALYVVAEAKGAPTPYMALKMGYLAIYPMAVLGALVIGDARTWMEGRLTRLGHGDHHGRCHSPSGVATLLSS